MFKIDPNKIVHRLKIATNFKKKTDFFNCFLAVKPDLLYENGFKCGKMWVYSESPHLCGHFYTKIEVVTMKNISNRFFQHCEPEV